MIRKFKRGGLYAIKSKREGSTFKLLVRLCVLTDPFLAERKERLYLENFATGELTPVKGEHAALADNYYEFEDEWDRFDVECVSTDVKSFIAYAGNRIHTLV